MPYKKSEKTKLRKDEKKKLIFETAAEIFANRGYHQTSVKDITDAAKISVGTFYLYFKNKEDLFEKLYDEMEGKLNRIQNFALARAANTPAEKFANVLSASIWAYQKYSELAKILLIEAVGLNPRFEEKYADIMIRSCNGMEVILKHLKDIGSIDVPDTKVAAIAYEGAFNHAIAFWLRADNKSDLKLYAYPLAAFSLQAMKMSFCEDRIRKSIDEMFQELDCMEAEQMQF